MEVLFLAILGGVIASFLNLVMTRRSVGLSIVCPSSFCFNCKKPLKAWHMLPVFSYIFYKGSCPYCKSKIPAFYFLSELAFSLIFPIFYIISDNLVNFLLAISTFSILYLMAGQDLKEKAVSNSYFAILGFIASFQNFVMLVNKSYNLKILIIQIILIFFYFLASKYDNSPMGEGDILAFALLLSFFHSYYAIIFLSLSFWLALFAYVFIKKIRYDKKVPMLPFICLSFLLTKILFYFLYM